MTFRVDQAPSGEEAIDLITATDDDPYAIVFIDWRMPEGIDGIETIRRIADLNIEEKPRPVMVTAYGRTEVMEEAHNAGIDIILVKPITPSQLHDAALHALRDDAEWSTAVREDTSPTAGLNLSAIQGARLLLVEDNDLNQQVAMELLQDAGFRVDLAENGQIAVEMVGATHYDTVLMDMQMPVMDGVTATLEIRGDGRFGELPIVAMTANAMARDRERCIQAGMNDHVAKPIDPQALFKKLLEWITPGEREPAPTMTHPTDSGSDPKPGTAMMPPSIDGTDDPLSSVPGLDTAAGIQRVAGKRDFYEKLVRQFAEGEESRTVETVRQLLSQDNRDEAERAAHSLKGVAGTLGADELQHRTQGLEVAIRENDNTFEFHLNTVQEELNRLIPLIQDALGVGESDSGSSSSPETIELSSKVLEKLPKLVSELEAYLDRVEELKATLTINEIEDFANEILSLGESTEYHPLSDWARRLLDAASMFEMDAISTELGAFSAQIEDIRQASK